MAVVMAGIGECGVWVWGPGLGPGTNTGAEVTVMGRGKAHCPAVLGWEGRDWWERMRRHSMAVRG